MTTSDLHMVLQGIEPHGEWVSGSLDGRDPVEIAWRRARREAEEAYECWRRRRDTVSYASYRACADRADAAQDALALAQTATHA